MIQPSPTAAKQHTVGDYSCLLLISTGSIALLKKNFFAVLLSKSAYEKPFSLKTEGHDALDAELLQLSLEVKNNVKL